MTDAAKLFATWRKDPVLFVRFAFNVEPDEWQAEALMDVANNDRVAIRSGHGVGKSAFLSWLILWWLTTRHPAKVPCTAPTTHQLEDVLWSEIAFWHRRMRAELRDMLEVRVAEVINRQAPREAFAVARVARQENPEAFQGFHSENLMFVVDEASGVSDVIFEVGSGSMSTEGAKTILVGNPTRTSGYFFDAFHKMRHLWKTRKVSCMDAKMVTPAYLELQKAKYGEESNAYRVRVLGDFPTSDDSAVIPLSWVEDAVDRDVTQKEGRTIWGVDVARFGDDRSALAKRKKNVLLEPVQSWKNLDLMQTSGRIINEYEATPFADRPDTILIDSIGLGAGVVDRLKEQGMPVRGINVAETPSIRAQYSRLRDELWWKSREWFDARDCKMPEDEALLSELSSPMYTFQSNGKILVESKNDMKKRGIRSPNLADAFNLTFAVSDSGRKVVKEEESEFAISPAYGWMGA